MTDLLSDLETPSDAELISRVRGGDVAAYGDLFSRHVDSANRLARQLVRGPDSDDLVSEAFAKVLQVLQGGGGPDVAFRAYLLTAVRRLHIDRMRAGARVQTSDDMADFDPGVPFTDTAVAQFESGAAARAFATLPERWQLVLWHLEVEGQKPAEIATLLGMSANSVSALAYRAREGLRQAFLTMHLNDITETDCRWVNEHLGAYVRKGLSKRDSTKVQQHLDDCRRCTAMYLELTEVNSNLRGIIAPVLLGAAAAGYLSSTGSAGGIGLAAFLGRARDVVSANAGAATAGAVAAGVAAVATAGIVLLPTNSPERIVGADSPVVRTSPDLSLPPSASPGGPSDAPSVAAPGGSQSGAPSPTPSAGASAPAALLDEGVGTTSGPAALPGEPGVLAPPLPGIDQPGPAGPGPAGPGPGTDPQPGPGTNPGPGPGTNPQPGPGTNPGPGPGTNPQPGPGTNPGPGPGTDPGPGPGTDPDPGPGPGTDPTTPTEPGGDPGTGGNDGEDGGDPDLLVSTLRVPTDQVNLSATSLTFPVQGDPALPPTLFVSMESNPEGFGFGSGVNCQPVQGDPTTAVCDTSPAGGGNALARVSADGGNNAFNVRLPLVVPDDVRSATLRISVKLPDGYDQTGNVTLEPLTWTASATEPDPDPEPNKADLTLDAPADVSPSDDGTYTVSAIIGGLPAGYGGPVTLRVDGAATFVDGDKALTLTNPGNGSVPIQLKATENTEPTTVRLSIDPLEGFDDENSSNNQTGEITLLAVPLTADLVLSGLPAEASPLEDGSYSVTGTVSGIPLEVTAADLTFTAGDVVTDLRWTFGECTEDGETKSCEVTFTMKDADGELPTSVTLTLTTLTDYEEIDTSNNAQTVKLLAPPVDAGVTAVLDEQGNSGKGTVAVSVTVDLDVPVELFVGFDWDEVQVTVPGDCREVETGIVCDLDGSASLSLNLLLENRSGNATSTATLTFRVAVSSQYRDTNSANDSASVTLDRFVDESPGSGDETSDTGDAAIAARAEDE